jgi:CRP/FNR family transcriptional regulator
MSSGVSIEENRRILAGLLSKKFKFRNVPKEDIDSLVSCCSFASFSRGSHIIMQDEEVKYLHFILSGSVENYLMTTKANRKVLNTLYAGDDFSVPDLIMSVHMNPKSIAYSLCLEDSVIAMITRDVFLNRCYTIPSINFAFSEMMATIIHELCSELMLSNAESKVASLLLYLGRKGTRDAQGQIAIGRNFSMQKCADVLSLARENVHRIMTDLEKRGAITMTKQEIIILDEPQLNDLSGGINVLMGFYGMHEN